MKKRKTETHRAQGELIKMQTINKHVSPIVVIWLFLVAIAIFIGLVGAIANLIIKIATAAYAKDRSSQPDFYSQVKDLMAVEPDDIWDKRCVTAV